MTYGPKMRAHFRSRFWEARGREGDTLDVVADWAGYSPVCVLSVEAYPLAAEGEWEVTLNGSVCPWHANSLGGVRRAPFRGDRAEVRHELIRCALMALTGVADALFELDPNFGIVELAREEVLD